jgi:MFS superfamily sulfate permease-like transporter
VQPAKQVVVKAPNGLCSPLLWGLHATAVVAGVATFDSTGAQAAVMGLFAAAYILLHARLLRSRARYRSALAA